MEKRGKGIIKMINLCKKAGLLEPKFEVVPDNVEVKVTFYAKSSD